MLGELAGRSPYLRMPAVALGFAALLALALALVLPAAAGATRSLYVTGNSFPGGLDGFGVAANGSLSPLVGSPFVSPDFRDNAAMTPDGAHLYIEDGNTGKITAYDVAANGSLTAMAGSPFASDANSGLTVSPDGKHLFAGGTAPGIVSSYDIGAGGQLTEVAGSPIPLPGDFPAEIAITPDGAHLYVTDQFGDDVSAYDVAANGSLSPVTGTPFVVGDTPGGLGITPDGRHLYTTSSGDSEVSGFDISASGSLLPVPGSPFATGSGNFVLAISPDGGRLYYDNAIVFGNIGGFAIAANGSLSALAGSPFTSGGNLPRGLVFSPDGKYLYSNGRNSDNVAALSVGAGGALTPIAGSPYTTSATPSSLAITPDQGPTAAFTTRARARSISFDAAASSDPDGTIARYDWEFGDGSTLPNGGPAPVHEYPADGSYTVRLTVTDNEGCSSTMVSTGTSVSCNAGPRGIASQAVLVDSKVDGAKLKAKKTQKQKGDVVVVKLKASAAEAVDLKAGGKVKAGRGSYKLKKATKSVKAGKSAGLKLKLKSKGDSEKVLRALGGKVQATVTVTFTDSAGNTAKKTAKIKLK